MLTVIKHVVNDNIICHSATHTRTTPVDVVVISVSAVSRTPDYLRYPPTQSLRLLTHAASSYSGFM